MELRRPTDHLINSSIYWQYLNDEGHWVEKVFPALELNYISEEHPPKSTKWSIMCGFFYDTPTDGMDGDGE